VIGAVYAAEVGDYGEKVTASTIGRTPRRGQGREKYLVKKYLYA